MKEYTVKQGQSLFDVAVMVYGSVQGIAWLLEDNGLNGPTDRLEAGEKLKVRNQVSNVRAKVFLESYPVVATIKESDKTEGIGYWKTEEYQIQ